MYLATLARQIQIQLKTKKQIQMQSNKNPGPVGEYKLPWIYNYHKKNTNTTERKETNTNAVKYKSRPSWRVQVSLDAQFSHGLLPLSPLRLFCPHSLPSKTLN